jgi:TrpR-related protein YerC/YecD
MIMKTDKKTRSLYQAILRIESVNEAKKFFRDLLTEAEIAEFANRWKAAQMLNDKIHYDTIAKETGMSSTTIARISKWLTNGTGGYKLMIKRTTSKQNDKHHHTSLRAV